jgi:Tfp pilus assembly protein PilN
MNETQLDNRIRALPRVKASPAFTSDVLRAVRRADAPRSAPFAWRLAAAFAMVLCVAALVQFALVRQEHRTRMAALREEQQRIQAELAAVKQIAREAEPVVVLENDRGTRVIMDLDSAVQTASYRTFD